MTARERGEAGERAACRFLESAGMTLTARNYRAQRCEIDLVMRDGSVTVFVEVKTRSRSCYGTPGEAVGPAKRARLIRAAQAYLQQNGLSDTPARFDVVEVYSDEGRINHIKDAFGQ